MPGFSSVVIMGHLVRDPELRYTPEGAAVSNFTVAVNHRFTTKDGKKGEEVAFVDVAAWNRQAETCAEYLKKGRLVHVLGRIAQDNWQDKETGKSRSKLRVVAQQVTFLGGGSKDEESTTEEPLPEETPAPPSPAKPAAKARK